MPEPEYTRAARNAAVRGLVILAAVFSENGTVEDVVVFRGLGHGLTENAIKAAKRIRFQPAIKNGHPVSMKMMIEYAFDLF